ncbi:MAG: Ig-like domain-containing protein [Alphaproteobacteria bacterium]|nr:Ig-like domain-containing protein [Alphaproteobacteria bacterium]
MADHKRSGETITLEASLQDVPPEVTEVTFAVQVDSEDQGSQTAPLNDDRRGARWEGYVLPDVAADKEKAILTATVTVGDVAFDLEGPDGEPLQVHIWPATLRVTVQDPAQAPRVGVTLRVTQRIPDTEAPIVQEPSTVEGGGLPEGFTLHPGPLVAIEVLEPDIEQSREETSLRELTLTVLRRVTATLIGPALSQPGGPPERRAQRVNLDTEDEGRDGKGDTITVQVGARGACDEGSLVFVEVTFDSVLGIARTTPLRAVEGLTAIEGAGPGKGTVALDAQGQATFTLKPGIVGGDTCTLRVGGADGAWDETLTLENWRALFYELMAPDGMAGQLPEQATEDGGAARSLPAAVQQRVDAMLAPAFVSYQPSASVLLTPEQHDDPVPAVFPPGYFLGPLAGVRSILSDLHANDDDPNRARFTRKDEVHTALLRLADLVVAPNEVEEMAFVNVTAATGLYERRPGSSALFLPERFDDGSSAVSGASWTAQLDPRPWLQHGAPNQTFTRSGAGAVDGHVFVEAAALGAPRLDLEFAKSPPLIGTRVTALTPTQQEQIRGWVRARLGDMDQQATATLAVQLVGQQQGGDEVSTARRQARLQAVTDALNVAFGALGPAHPGLDGQGQPKQGDLSADGFAFEREDRIRIDLAAGGAAEAAGFAGPPSPATCPVEVFFFLKTHREVTGGNRGGLNLVAVGGHRSVEAVAWSVCHELGHAMGLAPFPGVYEVAPGMPAAHHVDDGGTYYYHPQAIGGEGANGFRVPHQGPHCASGLNPGVRAGQDYTGVAGDCVMYGASTDRPPGVPTRLCDTCRDHLRARALKDIHAAWHGRGEEDR